MASSHRDYVPQNAAQFNEFMQKLVHYAEVNIGGAAPRWDTIPGARFTELTEAYSHFAAALQDANEIPTPANILRRNEAREKTIVVLRPFVNQFLRFPPITNADRVEMGIPNHDTIRSDHKVVTEEVDFVIHLGAIRELKIDFWIQGADHKAKPSGYDGAVIIWDIRDAPPSQPTDLANHIMASRTPFTLHFEEIERGKTVQIALAWQNERGVTGAWSEYKSAVIP